MGLFYEQFGPARNGLISCRLCQWLWSSSAGCRRNDFVDSFWAAVCRLVLRQLGASVPLANRSNRGFGRHVAGDTLGFARHRHFPGGLALGDGHKRQDLASGPKGLTKDRCRMIKEIPMTKPKRASYSMPDYWSLGFLSSFVIRHSSLTVVIQH